MAEPLFSCQFEGCREEVSYHAYDLGMWNGKPVCQGCYEFHSNDERDFNDLPEFVPDHVAEIERLTAVRAHHDALVMAAETLLLDVQDYEAWQRPCLAVDNIRAALAKVKEPSNG